jgi:ElaB/YqjD/DUF883 family membrane-anchored ribosome-binding protein
MVEDTRNLAEKEPAEIRQEIDETRSSITTKLEALEEQVVGTVQNARDSVQETIDTVKDTVQETVSAVKESVQETVSTVKESMQETYSTVKETFDLRLQTQRHPWPMLGGSVVAGFIAGALFGRVRRGREMPVEQLRSHGEVPQRTPPPPALEPLAAPAPREPGLLDRFQDEIDQVKGVAIGMMAGLVRDAIKDAVQERMPKLADQVEGVIDRITTKLGGKPVQGPVFREEAAPDLGPRY